MSGNRGVFYRCDCCDIFIYYRYLFSLHTVLFEKAAGSEKERQYEEFSLNVTEDRTIHKFWQLHRAMNGNKAQAQIPDFRREDDVWVRTPEEKGTAFLERFLRQTDQGNEEERSALIRTLQYHYRDYELTLPHEV